MATPIIRSSASVSGVVNGVGRNDLDIAETVVLSDTQAANSGATYLWVMEDTPVGSSATLVGPTSTTPSFVPDVTGSYRVKCTVNGVSSAVVILAVPLPVTGARIPSYKEDDAAEGYNGGGNTKGWQEAETVMWRATDSLLGSLAFPGYGVVGNISTIDIGDAAAAGGLAVVARADHQHPFAAPTVINDLGTTSALGSSAKIAREDHTHAHGNMLGGSLHAAASTTAAGFMVAAQVAATLLTVSTEASFPNSRRLAAGANITFDTTTAGVLTIAGAAGSSYTFTSGLTNASGTVTNDLITGKAGGQTIVGGTANSENLTYSSTSAGTKGKHIFGSTSGVVVDEATGNLGIGTTPASNFSLDLTKNTSSLWVNVKNTSTTGFTGLILQVNGTTAGNPFLRLTSSSNGFSWDIANNMASSAQLEFKSSAAGAVSPLILLQTPGVQLGGARTLASATSATWDGVDHIAATLTLSGSTAITTSTGVNANVFRAPTISAASALTVTAAATVVIAGAPIAGGAGPATITNAYSVWVQAGASRFDSRILVAKTAGSTGGTASVFGDPLNVNTASPHQVEVGNTSGTSNFIIGQSNGANMTFGWNYNATAGNASGVLQTFGYGNPIKIDAGYLQLQSSSGNNVGIGNTVSVASSVLRVFPAKTVASGASAIWDGVNVTASTLTLSGSTNVTTATGVNTTVFEQPTISAGSALTVTNAATVMIKGAPATGGAGPATITNAYALWIQGGAVRLDGLGATGVVKNTNGGVLSVGTLGASDITGGTDKQIAFYNSSGVLTSSSTFTWNNTNFQLIGEGSAILSLKNSTGVQASYGTNSLSIGGGDTAVVNTTGNFTVIGSRTIASGASAVWDSIDLKASTLTWSGSTGVTTATGVNYVTVRVPTFTAASAVATTNAATFAIAGAPAVSGSATVTNGYALWSQGGANRFDGRLVVAKTAAGTNTTTVFGDQLNSGTGAPMQLEVGNTSGNAMIRMGQDANHNIGFNWNYNATAALATGELNTFGNNNGLLLNGQYVALQSSNQLGVGIGTSMLSSTNTLKLAASPLTIASGASVAWDGLDMTGFFVLSGSTNVTTATGVNMAVFEAPTISAASALTVTTAATVTILGAPVAGGVGPATITNPRAFWVQSGISRFDGDVVITSTNASGNPLSTTVPGLRIRNTTGNVSVMQFSFTGTGDVVGSAIAGTNTGIQVATQGNFVVTTTSGLVEAMRVTANGNTCVGTQTDNAATRLRVDPSKTVASGTSAVWDGVDFISSTLTLSGSTAITTATGVNMVVLRAPTLTYGSGAITVTNAATLAIAGAPIAGGTGPTVITNSYAIWSQGGQCRFDGQVTVGGLPPVAGYNFVVRAAGATGKAQALVYSGNAGDGRNSQMIIQSGNVAALVFEAFNTGSTGTTCGISNADLSALYVSAALSGGNLLLGNTKAFDLVLATNNAEFLRGTSGGNLSLFQASSFGGGAGVLAVKNATTAPTSAPSGGVLLDAESGRTKIYDPSGVVTILN